MSETRPDHWLYVAAPILLYWMIVFVLLLAGDHGEERNPIKALFRRISWSLERATGYAAWAMAGALSALNALLIAMLGLYWDVAFHIDVGRDEELFTPSHTMILIGLGSLVYSAVVAVIFANVDGADVGFRLGRLRVPWTAAIVAALGLGGVAAFPLDDLWHKAYGVDVTLWSPTHLQLVAGGSLAPIAVWLMLREGRRTTPGATVLGRAIEVISVGAVLTGMSTVQGEFDFGVPQFQAAYLPLLVAFAAGFSLVLARIGIGPGGAMAAAVVFIALRSLVVAVVSGGLNHTVPRFPLYLAAALAVEAVAWVVGTARPLVFAAVAGLAVATVGLAGEIAWIVLSGWYPVAPAVLPKVVLLAPLAAVGAAVLGAAVAAPVAVGRAVPLAAAAASVLAVAVAMAVPLPRQVGQVEAVVRLHPADDQARSGDDARAAGAHRGNAGDQARVEVELIPADAARRATAFGVVSWQGGGRVRAALEEVAPGRYLSSRPVPIGGRWKTTVGLLRGNEVMAVPVYLPADPPIGAPEIPAVPERRAPFVRNTVLLLREAHPGESWPAYAAYAGVAVVALVWMLLFGTAAARLAPAPARGSARRPPEREDDSLDRWRAGLAAARQ